MLLVLKFDAVIGLLKANQKAELMKQADEARAAGNTTLADELTAQATALDDFILRPGMSPLKFNEGDLLIGKPYKLRLLYICNLWKLRFCLELYFNF